jgi:hypothetical protein
MAREGSSMDRAAEHAVTANLIAVLVAVSDGEPRVMTLRDASALPSGPFELGHRSLQSGLRAWVEQQTGHPLGYLEQLYTFADRDRTDAGGARVISISYLGLTREEPAALGRETGWRSWYEYFPWEDQRQGAAASGDDLILTRLEAWAEAADDPALRREHRQRLAIAFGPDGAPWNEELILQRYELLYEAGLVPEALRAHPDAGPPVPGRPMEADHRRILATGIARLRAKIKYRPIVFELMPPAFTLLQLQRTVEAIAGRPLHKQNFRRLIEQQGLVEETGEMLSATGGRPAKLVRFRGEVVLERAVIGSKLPLSRSA